MLQWTEQFSTGSSNLDYQHQTLIDNLNDLEKLLAVAEPTGEDCQFMMHLVDFLEHYADNHFKCEEQCMEYFRCPSHEQNKAAHLEFLFFFRQFKAHSLTTGFSREMVATLHATLHRWIVEHILHVDTQLKPLIKG